MRVFVFVCCSSVCRYGNNSKLTERSNTNQKIKRPWKRKTSPKPTTNYLKRHIHSLFPSAETSSRTQVLTSLLALSASSSL